MDARCSTRRRRTGRRVCGLLTVAKVLRRVAEQGAGGGERNQAERTEGRTVRVAALGWLDGDRSRRGD